MTCLTLPAGPRAQARAEPTPARTGEAPAGTGPAAQAVPAPATVAPSATMRSLGRENLLRQVTVTPPS